METPGLVWTRPPTTSAGRGRPLRIDRACIATAAVAILDEDGIEAMTMRGLAERLDVAVGTLYTYVSGREGVFDLACDQGLADLPDWYAADGNWLDSARAYLDSLRQVCRTHEWWPILYPWRPIIGPHGMRLREQVLAVLARAGFPLAQREPVMSALTHLAIGTMLIENTWRIWPEGDPAGTEAVKAHVASDAAHPNYQTIFNDYLLKTDPDDAREARWRTAVESTLAGLEQQLPRR